MKIQWQMAYCSGGLMAARSVRSWQKPKCPESEKKKELRKREREKEPHRRVTAMGQQYLIKSQADRRILLATRSIVVVVVVCIDICSSRRIHWSPLVPLARCLCFCIWINSYFWRRHRRPSFILPTSLPNTHTHTHLTNKTFSERPTMPQGEAACEVATLPGCCSSCFSSCCC